ncbi:hypothetical protein AB0D04_09655 [Streptomyces sp. NPDC048483]|uniref:hypothetical protein n=1 Tax=Streptomyces sp. NPDC048483 TaxID=3154927 RepID=UPI0034485420
MRTTKDGDVGSVFWSWPAVAVSMAALLGEVLVAGAGLTMYGFTEEGAVGNVFLMAFVLPFALLLGAVPGFALTVTLVLPTLWLARWAVRRRGGPGRPKWWATAAAAPFPAAGATLLDGTIRAVLSRTVGAPLGYLGLWLVLTAAVIPAALLAAYAARNRGARRAVRLTITVAAGGVAAVVGVFLLGVGAYAVGLLEEYRAPHLERAELVGVWKDGSGGILRLDSGGTASASRLGERGERCTGTGVWELEGTVTDGEQEVGVTGACPQDWSIGGTKEKPALYFFVGDPDEGRRHVLTRQGGAQR